MTRMQYDDLELKKARRVMERELDKVEASSGLCWGDLKSDGYKHNGSLQRVTLTAGPWIIVLSRSENGIPVYSLLHVRYATEHDFSEGPHQYTAFELDGHRTVVQRELDRMKTSTGIYGGVLQLEGYRPKDSLDEVTLQAGPWTVSYSRNNGDNVFSNPRVTDVAGNDVTDCFTERKSILKSKPEPELVGAR